MSETYTHHSHEQDKSSHELEDHNKEALDALAEKGREARDQNEENKSEQLNELRNEANAEAEPAQDLLAEQLSRDEPAAPAGLVGRDLKQIKYKRTLQSVQKGLSNPEKTLSKLIHNPVIDAVSTAAEKTVARPSGLLTGSIFAFLGSSMFLYIAKHYGYEYNFLLFALFFFGGFALGLLIELVYKLIKRPSRS